MRTILLAAGWIGALIMGIAMLGLLAPALTYAACQSEPITEYTPTGISGCERWGRGTASHYGPGSGVAMNFCTWERRQASGCGSVMITSLDTGKNVTAPVIDFGDLYTGTPDERIVDLHYGVVEALGLDLSQGLYEVEVWPAPDDPPPGLRFDSGGTPVLPNTAGIGPEDSRGMDTDVFAFRLGQSGHTDSRMNFCAGLFHPASR